MIIKKAMNWLQARQLGFDAWNGLISLDAARAALGNDPDLHKAFDQGWDDAALGDFC